MEALMKADNFVVKQASFSDGQSCNDFYNKIYSRERSLVGWQWEFGSNKLEDDLLTFTLVETLEGVVATQAYLPIDFVDERGTFQTGKSEETLVDPAMRGKGLFEKMYDKLFEISREQKILGLWGFSPATKAFERLGFSLPGKVGQLILPLKVSFVEDALEVHTDSAGAAHRIRNFSAGVAAKVMSAARSRKMVQDSRISISTLTEAPKWADELSQRFANQWGGLTIHRSAEYLNWRFFSNPF